jgi:hypothetical protein
MIPGGRQPPTLTSERLSAGNPFARPVVGAQGAPAGLSGLGAVLSAAAIFKKFAPTRIGHENRSPAMPPACHEICERRRHRPFAPTCRPCGSGESRNPVSNAANRREVRAILRSAGIAGKSTRLGGWGARIRTWDHGTKTRCLTAWPRPNGLVLSPAPQLGQSHPFAVFGALKALGGADRSAPCRAALPTQDRICSKWAPSLI